MIGCHNLILVLTFQTTLVISTVIFIVFPLKAIPNSRDGNSLSANGTKFDIG